MASKAGGGKSEKEIAEEKEKGEGEIAELQKNENSLINIKKALVRNCKSNLYMVVMTIRAMDSSFGSQYETMDEKLKIMMESNPEEFGG